MHIMQSRRDFLTTLSAAGAASILGGRTSLADEPPPETTIVRLEKQPNICFAPQYVAEELLRAEGFTDLLPKRLCDGCGEHGEGQPRFLSELRRIDDPTDGFWGTDHCAGRHPSWLLRAVCP